MGDFIFNSLLVGCLRKLVAIFDERSALVARRDDEGMAAILRGEAAPARPSRAVNVVTGFSGMARENPGLVIGRRRNGDR
jgi:hypothetical protein